MSFKDIDDREREAVFGFTLRYILNAKKPSLKKVFNRQKQENKIKKIFGQTDKKSNIKQKNRAIEALNYLKNRR